MPPDPIGFAVARLFQDQPQRFVIRFSGGGLDHMCAEVVDRAEQAVHIVCPAETDPDRCCATCALCFNSTRSITFIRH